MLHGAPRHISLLLSPPEVSDYAALVIHQSVSGMVGRKQLWPRSSWVLPSELGFFKPETSLYIETYRSAKRARVHPFDRLMDGIGCRFLLAIARS